jgi:hypothetical protein
MTALAAPLLNHAKTRLAVFTFSWAVTVQNPSVFALDLANLAEN